MQWTRRELLKLAGETGFEAPSLEKVGRLGEVLEVVAAHPRLSRSLVLKGGTALNLFFGPPSRLSVDLDFNYIGQLERREMRVDRPLVEESLEQIARGKGYAVQRSREAHAGRSLYLSYRRTVDGLRDRVILDVNFLHRQCLLEATQRTMWLPGTGGAGIVFSTVSFDELAAGKLIALLDRAAPRDAWDASRLAELSGGRWPGPHSKLIFVAMAGALPHALSTYSTAGLDRITDLDVRRVLHPMLVEGERPPGEELRRRARGVLAPFLDLSAQEKEYCDRLQRGELVPELLFPDAPDLAARVAASPPLRWKAQNARRWRKAP